MSGRLVYILRSVEEDAEIDNPSQVVRVDQICDKSAVGVIDVFGIS